jgi:DNA polymerase-1
MILQVHDELVFEAPESEVEELRELARHEMASVVKLKVALQVEVGVGMSWAEAH